MGQEASSADPLAAWSHPGDCPGWRAGEHKLLPPGATHSTFFSCDHSRALFKPLSHLELGGTRKGLLARVLCSEGCGGRSIHALLLVFHEVYFFKCWLPRIFYAEEGKFIVAIIFSQSGEQAIRRKGA